MSDRAELKLENFKGPHFKDGAQGHSNLLYTTECFEI